MCFLIGIGLIFLFLPLLGFSQARVFHWFLFRIRFFFLFFWFCFLLGIGLIFMFLHLLFSIHQNEALSFIRLYHCTYCFILLYHFYLMISIPWNGQLGPVRLEMLCNQKWKLRGWRDNSNHRLRVSMLVNTYVIISIAVGVVLAFVCLFICFFASFTFLGFVSFRFVYFVLFCFVYVLFY
jgi:hypothetical protein